MVLSLGLYPDSKYLPLPSGLLNCLLGMYLGLGYWDGLSSRSSQLSILGRLVTSEAKYVSDLSDEFDCESSDLVSL